MIEKDSNMFQCTGTVTYKNYNEETGILHFGLKTFIDKKYPQNGGYAYERDYPGFVLEGKKALLFKDRFEVNDRLMVIGHIDTLDHMIHVGGRNYIREFRTMTIVDQIFLNAGRPDINHAHVAGIISRCYTNSEEGKRFYIITVMVPYEGKTPCKVSFIYFDRSMRLNPKIGDYVDMSGCLQTKNDRSIVNDRPVNRTILSVVARRLTLKPSDSEKE